MHNQHIFLLYSDIYMQKVMGGDCWNTVYLHGHYDANMKISLMIYTYFDPLSLINSSMCTTKE